jgi:anti-sigma factor RsiW
MAGAIADEILIAFLHGELDEIEIQRVEAAMVADPGVERRLEALAGQDDDIRNAFAAVLEAPVPGRLTAIVNETQPEAQIVDLKSIREDRMRRRWQLPHFGAIAASLAIGLVAGWQASNPDTASPDALVIASAGGPVLTQAADAFLASARSGERKSLASLGTASVTISFKTAEGILCRQFALDGGSSVSDGVACREGTGWRLHALGVRPGETGEMRTASGDAAPAVLAAVDVLIDGDPLDAAAENDALTRQ